MTLEEKRHKALITAINIMILLTKQNYLSFVDGLKNVIEIAQYQCELLRLSQIKTDVTVEGHQFKA